MKIAICQECNVQVEYTTKKPNHCKECHDKLFGDRKFYKKPKTIPKKSKGEFYLNKILNEMFPDVPSIDGGYYSFLPSPKGYPMQLDRYYPRLHLAFEFNGKQHVEDSAYFYKTDEEFNYRKECDELKERLCKEKNITIINISHDEFITKELIIDKLIEKGMLTFVQGKTQIVV